LAEEALAGLFVKAFDLGDGPDAIAGAKAKQLALDWYKFMGHTHVEVAEVLTIAKTREDARLKKLEELAKAKKDAADAAAAQKAQMQTVPGQFGNPMGYPGAMAPPAAAQPPQGRGGKFTKGGFQGDR